jgi:hypothetical protein
VPRGVLTQVDRPRGVREAILKLLPEDGTPVLNRVMQVMLTRSLGRQISQEEYFAARDNLFENDLIGRLRGQGGTIFLAKQHSESRPPERAAALTERWTEARLMEPLREFLEGSFRVGLDLPSNAFCVVQDTSRIGPTKGRWARPDFVLVSAMKFKLMSGAQVDVHSFELKTETGVDNLAVYEALAQTRFTHFGHLVWHLPRNSPQETILPEIKAQCDEHGVGLIRIIDPKKPEATEILLDPVRKETLPALVDSFLESRLNEVLRGRLARAIGGNSQ